MTEEKENDKLINIKMVDVNPTIITSTNILDNSFQNVETLSDMKQRKPTSIMVEPALWKEVKIASIRMGIITSDFMELALRRELKRLVLDPQ